MNLRILAYSSKLNKNFLKPIFIRQLAAVVNIHSSARYPTVFQAFRQRYRAIQNLVTFVEISFINNLLVSVRRQLISMLTCCAKNNFKTLFVYHNFLSRICILLISFNQPIAK